MSENDLPLSGMRVLDVATFIAPPDCTATRGGLGAGGTKEGEPMVVCAGGQRSALAGEMAEAGGFAADVLHNREGGAAAWIKAGEPVEQ